MRHCRRKDSVGEALEWANKVPDDKQGACFKFDAGLFKISEEERGMHIEKDLNKGRRTVEHTSSRKNQ
jgi:hypothetical protein